MLQQKSVVCVTLKSWEDLHGDEARDCMHMGGGGGGGGGGGWWIELNTTIVTFGHHSTVCTFLVQMMQTRAVLTYYFEFQSMYYDM